MPAPKGYKRKRIANWRRVCAAGSIRTVKSGKARVLVCCPKKKWKGSRCKVGMRAVSLDVPRFGSLATAAKKEHREHPWTTMAQARRIARDHARKKGFGEPLPAGMKVRKDPDFDYNGEWIVNYAGQTFRIYHDKSISHSWEFIGPEKRHGENVIGIGNRAETLAKLKQMIDANDPRLARHRVKK